MKNSTYIEKKWMQFKVSALSASITALVVSGIPTQISASDIDIYQSGGTGATTIYMMLDKSGSMDYAKGFYDDYGYIYGSHEEKNKNICNSYYYVGPDNNASYGPIANGDFSNWGEGSGDYNLMRNNRGCSNTTYIVKDSVCVRKLSNLDLSIKFQSNDYYYVKKNQDGICEVDFSLFPNKTGAEKVKIDKVKNRVKNTCTDISGNGTKYRCLSRMAKLREGLMKMIVDSSVDKSKGFALGVYSGSSAQTLLTFTEMTDDNKKKILQKIESITAEGGTPIGAAYKKASAEFDTSLYFNDKSKLECSGNGIYFMTDGEPSNDNTTFDYGSTTNYTKVLPSGKDDSFWNKIGYQAQYLKDSKFKIKTATVGLGSEYYFETLPEDMNKVDCSIIGTAGSNSQSLCKWGAKTSNIGSGGFYTVQSTDDLIKSLKQFISDVTVPIEGSTMGASTIPVDALNTTQLQPYSYFPMFKPLIGSKDQLWAGNLKKFKVLNGTIVDTKEKTVFEDSKIRAQLQDYWFSVKGSGSEDQFMTWGGHLSRLKTFNLPQVETSSTTLNKNLYIDVNGELKKVTDVLNSNDKPENSQYLYGLMGFSKLKEADFTALGDNKTYTQQLAYLKDRVSTASGYQMGAVIHSTPVLLTQKGAIEVEKGVQSSKDREDYIMFGTTQGVLHIVKAGQQNTNSVDAEGGKDVFSFVPNEFLTRQSKGFAESLAMGRTDSVNTFFYGIDGPWVAHTVYEPSITDFYKKDENGNDVIENGQKVIESTRGSLVVKADSKNSHQYVYGGLRMGGRSYYALNLSDMSKPKLMFHVNPDAETLTTDDPLYHMGQSWSQPTLTYIKWNGEKKLAMIVGGGYDIKYEDPTFTNSVSGGVKGNGVYIFDAENGKLLWWGSSSIDLKDQSPAAVNSDGAVTKPESTIIGAMVNSIPSRVKAIDRDGDGITDHLYVGDLGGKLFRIDLNPKHTISEKTDKKKSFILNAFALADVGSRRFYEAPTFTIHKSGMTRYAVLSMGSGDRSSPLSNSSSNDLLVGIYDTSVTKTIPAVQATVSLGNLREIYKDNKEDEIHQGWYYTLPKLTVKDTTYQQRILEEGVALDNSLYYPIFNPQKSTANVDATSCTGGITGESTLYQFCLPSGECVANQDAPKSGGPLGSGILGLAVGPGSGDNKRTFVFNKKPDPIPDEFETLNKLLPQRWFEYSPYKVKGDK
ncbi:hypothetical protein H0S57_15290 [Acinetobacter johnsonii]|uniref:PilC/PilY family type IV pilus protein n=1 Tax=Acinetobacter johnsonii TaxID=40214 RepID=UPI00189CBC8B|nr:PilC/PilY family type IV pilus protein [Acinetobacter johnsonii]QPF34763.1 hypothetical protein H0S57_15290 [Acinetobacter johnsonii]